MLGEINTTLRTELEAARSSFTAHALTVVYDNRPLDTTNQTLPHLAVTIRLIDGERASIYSQVEHLVIGELRLVAKVKKGEGSYKCNAILDHFYPRLQCRTVSRIHLQGASFEGPSEDQGWYTVTAIIPFRTIKTY